MKLTVLYDPRCCMCTRARDWLSAQAGYVELDFLPLTAPAVALRYPALLQAELEKELHVVADDGRVWRGASAWLMCLWALQRTRGLALRLAHPAGLAIVKPVVARLSEGRYSISQALRWEARAR